MLGRCKGSVREVLGGGVGRRCWEEVLGRCKVGAGEVLRRCRDLGVGVGRRSWGGVTVFMSYL